MVPTAEHNVDVKKTDAVVRWWKDGARSMITSSSSSCSC
jgi:hypothetical protein